MRKLWNRPAYPVWSLVTKDVQGVINMNICTYVVSASLSPKLMTIAVYHGTKTLANLESNPQQTIVLQLLAEDQAPLVRLLGQQSGHAVDKYARLQKRQVLVTVGGHTYLKDVLGYVVLEKLLRSEVQGDHVLYTGTVHLAKNLRDAPVLTTTYLRDHKYTR